MSFRLPQSSQELVEIQCGVITRSQALDCGISADTIGRNVRLGRWQLLYRGVYLAHTAAPDREARLWAAGLFAGPDAALSHQTAAELFGLTDKQCPQIHITIPEYQRIRPVAGLVIHRSGLLADSIHPIHRPQRTRIEATVLDLVGQAATAEAVFGIVSAACQRRLTTPGRLTEAMNRRKKLRWRKELAQALGEVSLGVHSLLERRYVHLVERPHRLPVAIRQAKLADRAKNRYLDNLYEEFQVCVELDGRQAHPDDRRWTDQLRVNSIAAHGIVTLRYGWREVNYRPCETAAEIATVLRSRGWLSSLHRCDKCP